MRAGEKITIATREGLRHDMVWIVDGGTFTARQRSGFVIEVFQQADEGVTWIYGWRIHDRTAVEALNILRAAQALA